MAKAKARHILLTNETAANELKRRIEAGADFAKMAQEFSQCPSKRKGGDLGEFSPGQMVPEFDEVVFKGPLKKVLGPVKTEFGYHLIEVLKRSK